MHRPHSFPRIVLLALLAAMLGAGPAVAAWPPAGAPMSDSTTYVADAGAILSDGLGGCYVAWRDYRDYATGESDVYLQHLTAEGAIAPGWPEATLPIATGPGSLVSEILLVPDPTGGVYVVWSDNRNRQYLPGSTLTGDDIYAQRVLANGTLAPGWPVNGLVVCGEAGNQNFPRACSDGVGGIFIAWRDERSPATQTDVYVQRLNPAGETPTGWPSGGFAACRATGHQPWIDIAGDATSGALVAWSDGRASVSDATVDIFGVVIAADGQRAPGWSEDGNPLCSAAGLQTQPRVTEGPGNSFYVAWRDFRSAPASDPDDDTHSDIYMARFDGEGQLAPGWPIDGLPICTAPEIQVGLSLESDASGGALLSWGDYRGPAIATYAQRVLADGSVAPGWIPDGTLVSTAPEFQLYPRLAPDGLGGAFVAFEQLIATGSAAYIQHLTAGGTIAPGFESTGLTIPTGYGQQEPVVAASRPGVAIMAWVDGRKFVDGFSFPEMYALPFGTDVPTATQVALQSAIAEPGLARLAWLVSGSTSLRATVERRTETTEWAPLGSLIADGTGRVAYVDATVEAGRRYAYRLRYSDGDTEATTPDAWLDIPLRFELALAGFRPNPATSGDLTVAFSLPSQSSGSLDVLDVTGRRVTSRDLSSLGAGPHTLRLAGERGLHAGVYWLRLSHAGRALTARGVVVE